MGGRAGGRTPHANVSSASRPAGVYSQTGRQATAVRDSDDQGSGGADGDAGGPGADLRGRPAAGATRLPTGTKCSGRCGEGPGTDAIGAYGGGGRGPERVFRQHSA